MHGRHTKLLFSLPDHLAAQKKKKTIEDIRLEQKINESKAHKHLKENPQTYKVEVEENLKGNDCINNDKIVQTRKELKSIKKKKKKGCQKKIAL